MNLREISSLLYQIKLTNQKANTLFEKETGFSLTRYEMLMILKEKGVCSQNKIQVDMKIDGAAITRHLKILEESGFVHRNRNVDNNREVFVELSNKAKNELDACEKEHGLKKISLHPSINDEEAYQLSDLLKRLYE